MSYRLGRDSSATRPPSARRCRQPAGRHRSSARRGSSREDASAARDELAIQTYRRAMETGCRRAEQMGIQRIHARERRPGRSDACVTPPVVASLIERAITNADEQSRQDICPVFTRGIGIPPPANARDDLPFFATQDRATGYDEANAGGGQQAGGWITGHLVAALGCDGASAGVSRPATNSSRVGTRHRRTTLARRYAVDERPCPFQAREPPPAQLLEGRPNQHVGAVVG